MKLLAKDAQKPYYELRQYMSYQVKRKRIEGDIVTEFVELRSGNEFPKLFHRHYREYIQDYPEVTPEQYRLIAIGYIDELLNKLRAQTKPESLFFLIKEVQWAKKYKRYLNLDNCIKYIDGFYGIKTPYSSQQLELIHDRLCKDGYIKTPKLNFIAAMTPELNTIKLKKIKWTDVSHSGVNAGHSNKATLRAFLEVIKGGNTVQKSDINKFADHRGNDITLNKPNKDAYHERNIKKIKSVVNQAINGL